MNQTALQLASLRLAPRQLSLWGHPETTGLPTIDGYISADLFEPEDSARFYSEELIRLAGIGSFYEPTIQDIAPFDLTLLRDGNATIILCPGAPFKYQPEDDDVLVNIARSAAPVKLIFFRLKKHRWMSEQLESRLRKKFLERGLEFDRSCVFLDWLEAAEFHGLLTESDIVLDTIGFSGFNTAMQSIEAGVPYVAFDGQFMRGRLASGLMRAMDIPELIARSRTEFVEISASLARDQGRRAELRNMIESRRRCLFRDHSAVRSLEAVLLRQ